MQVSARRYSLQFSSSLPSGQSSKPLQRKRPMMQCIPLAQAKNVGAHRDFTLAETEEEAMLETRNLQRDQLNKQNILL